MRHCLRCLYVIVGEFGSSLLMRHFMLLGPDLRMNVNYGKKRSISKEPEHCE